MHVEMRAAWGSAALTQSSPEHPADVQRSDAASVRDGGRWPGLGLGPGPGLGVASTAGGGVCGPGGATGVVAAVPASQPTAPAETATNVKAATMRGVVRGDMLLLSVADPVSAR